MEQPRRKQIRLAEYDYSTAGYYFITIVTHERQPFFAGPAGKWAEECLLEVPAHDPRVKIDQYCVMPDHIHAIFIIENVGAAYMPPEPRPRDRQTLFRAIQQYKSAVTRKSGIKPLWQRGYYDHIIRNDFDLSETRNYIQTNPLQVEKGGIPK